MRQQSNNFNLLQEKEDIIASLPVRSDIFLPTSKISLPDQVTGLKKVSKIYRKDLDELYRPRLRQLKKGFRNKKRCFLIGNGPSLNHTDLTLLEDEITFAANGFFLKSSELNWKPTFYVVEDHLVAEDRVKELNQLKGPIKLYPVYLGYCMKAADDTIFFNHRPRTSYPEGFDFSLCADKVTYTGCTVMFTMMQLAAYLGFEEIYLIGVDANYELPSDVKVTKEYGTSILNMQTDDANHFHPDYFGKGYRWHDPQVHKMIEAYSEARKICDLNNIVIKNATIGGNLEIFERIRYESLFEKFEENKNKINGIHKPRVIVIDFTRFGNNTATGEIKTKFFSTWSKSSIFHIYSESGIDFGISENDIDDNKRYTELDVLARAKNFNADLILYRPVGNDPHLFELAMILIAELKKPFIIWMMDDWPARQEVFNPLLKDKFKADLQYLSQSANECFAISDSMAGAFGARYGANFTVFHNGISPKLWDLSKRNGIKNKILTIRYSGGLAKDMTLKSLIDIVEAVQEISSEIEVKFEIRCQQHWFDKVKNILNQYSVVSLDIANQSMENYRQWLVDADLLVICNNFDIDSLIYTQYSFANKIPEYLASGQAVFAYGPTESSSINYLKSVDGVTCVSIPDKTLLKKKLYELLSSDAKRKRLGEMSKTYALRNLDFDITQKKFISTIKRVANSKYNDFVYSRSEVAKKQLPSDIKHTAVLIREIGRYIISLKGLLGLISVLLSALGIFLCLSYDIIFMRVFGILLIAAAQGIIILLIAHLAAHMNISNRK